MVNLVSFFSKTILIGAVALQLSGCDRDVINVRGFILPEGDVAQGEQTFVALGCPACHTVFNTEISQPDDAEFSVALGGEYLHIKHYGDLLTSIVNPDHRVLLPSKNADGSDREPGSPMPQYLQTMTVEQLIDVVAFLHGKYEKLPHYGGKYYYYPGA